MMMMMMMKRVSHNIKVIRTIGKHTHQHYILTTNADVKCLIASMAPGIVMSAQRLFIAINPQSYEH